MALTQKSMTDVVTALNSGELTMDQLLAQLATEKQYVRRGSSYSELKFEVVSQINGEFAKVFTVETKRIDRAGKEVERKSRKNGDGTEE